MRIGFSYTLDIPAPGDFDWDDKVRQAFTDLVDAIVAGVSSDGINIQSSLDFQGQKAINVGALNLSAVTADDGTAGAIFRKTDGEIWIRDGAGRSFALTSSGSLSISGTGGIGGAYVSSGASLSYNAGTGKYIFQTSTPGTYATIETSDVQVHNGNSSTYVDIKASPVQGSTYNLTLPSAVPSAVSVLVMDTTGTLATSRDLNLAAVTASNALFTNPRMTGPAPASGYGLLVADATGTISSIQTGSFQTDYVDVCQGAGIGVGATYNGTSGWILPASNALMLPVDYTVGDEIVGVGFYSTTATTVTASLFHRGAGNSVYIARCCFNDTPGWKTLSGSVPTMTGTLPFVPPGTGSLSFHVIVGAGASTDTLDCFRVIRNKKLV